MVLWFNCSSVMHSPLEGVIWLFGQGPKVINHSITRTFSRFQKWKNQNFSSMEKFLCNKISTILLHKNFSVDEKFQFLYFHNLENVLNMEWFNTFGSSKKSHAIPSRELWSYARTSPSLSYGTQNIYFLPNIPSFYWN